MNQKYSIPISRTNYNRLMYGTHSVKRILELEGMGLKDNHIDYKGGEIHIDNINFCPKFKKK